MKRQWLRYSAIAIVFYLVFLIATAPAVWAAWALVRFTHGVVSLNEPQDTIWHGQGNLVVHYATSPPSELGIIRWSVNPLWFFTGRVKVHATVNGPGMEIHGNFGFGFRNLSLSDVKASFPARLVATVYSPLALFAPSGQVTLSSKQFLLGRGATRGSAVVDWQDAGSSLSSVHPLGSYRLTVQGEGRGANLQLVTTSGDLVLTGKGQLEVASGQIQFNGIARPAAHASELEPLLKLLGPDRGGGQRILVANGLRLF